MTPDQETAAIEAAAIVIHAGGCAPCSGECAGDGTCPGPGGAERDLAAVVVEAVAPILDGSKGSAPVHLGEYARVDIMGHDWRVGWVSDGSMAGAACLDVRDGSGRLVAKIPPHTVYLYSPLDPPRLGEVRAALPAGDEDGEDAWAGDLAGGPY